ncbi:MAG: Lpg1974 family pore-forming outer membrane protein [Gemmataceae bacterium]
MRRLLTSGLTLLALQGMATVASAQGYYPGYPIYPPQMVYPSQLAYPPLQMMPPAMYNPAMYPLPNQTNTARTKTERPPEGILPTLIKLASNKTTAPANTPSTPNPTTGEVITHSTVQKLPAVPLSLPETPKIESKPVVKESINPSTPPPAAPEHSNPSALPPASSSSPTGSRLSSTVVPCDDCASAAEKPWLIYGLAGVSVLRSNISERQAFGLVHSSTIVNGTVQTTNLLQSENFSPGIEVTPLIIVGAMNKDGLGVRSRFWYFQEEDERLTANTDRAGNVAVVSALNAPFQVISSASRGGTVPPPTGGGALALGIGTDAIQATHHFRAWVIDLEATRYLESGPWSLIAGSGLRYARLEQDYGFLRMNAGTNGIITFDTDSEYLNARHKFEGVGPTLSAELWRDLGFAGLSIYSGARGSLLIGRHSFRNELHSRTVASAIGGTFDSSELTVGTSGSTRMVPVGELEIGAQYTRQLGSAVFIARAGFQAQTWFDAGNLSSTNNNIDFYGGNFLLGLQY